MNENHSNMSLSPPISRQQILNMFQKYGYPAYAMIDREKMQSIFQSEYARKKNSSISKELLQQIWYESEATTKGEISVSTIADIVLQAQKILSSRVDKLSGEGGMINVLNKKIQEKDIQLKQFAQYHGEDRDELNEVTKELINMQIQQKQNQQDLKAFIQDYQSINNIFLSERPREYTQYLLPTKKQTIKLQKSNRLLTLFHLTNVLLLVQFLIISSLRLSFLPLTAILHSYYVLLLGINSIHTLTYLVLHILASFICDLAFVVIFIMNKYEIMPIHHSNNAVYTIILLILLIGTLALRALIIVLYVSLRTAYNPRTIHYFSLMGYTFPPKQISQPEPGYGYYSQYYKQPEGQPITPSNKDVRKSEYINEVSHVEKFNPEPTLNRQTSQKDKNFNHLQ